jgi:hypothetical protein
MLVDEGVGHVDLVASSHKVLFFLSPGIPQRDRVAEFPGLGYGPSRKLSEFFLMPLFIYRNKALGFCGAYCAVSFLASKPENFATI